MITEERRQAFTYRKRKTKNLIMMASLVLTAIVVLLPLFSILGYVLVNGAPGLSWSFFTEMPKPVGEAGGGMLNALSGTIVMIALASAIGVTTGLGAGIYLSEFPTGWFPNFVRFCAEILTSVPSIVIGLFVYLLIVLPMKRFSAIAGGAALGIIMIPIVARSSEEILKRVPSHMREAGLALGIPRWKVILFIVLRGSRKGVITCVMLAVARIAGETAPLLFTALNNRFWSWRLDNPMASLPVQIFTYSIAPFDEWHQQAWTGALVLVGLVLTLNLATRLATRSEGSSR